MPLDTRQKVLVGIIIVLIIILTVQISLLLKLRAEHGHLTIPFLHQTITSQNNLQKSATIANTDNNAAAAMVFATHIIPTQNPSSGANTTENQVASSGFPNAIQQAIISNNKELPKNANTPVTSTTDSLVNVPSVPNSSNLNLQKPVIPSATDNLVNVPSTTNSSNSNLQKPIVPTATQNNANSITVTSSHNSITNSNAMQNTNVTTLTDADKQYIQSLMNTNLAAINDKLKQNNLVVAAANNNATQALAAVNATQANTNNRFNKLDAAIASVNESDDKSYASLSSSVATSNDRLDKDEAAIAAANDNTNKTFAAISSTIATTNNRLTKDEAAITMANNNAAKLLAAMANNTKVTIPIGQVNSASSVIEGSSSPKPNATPADPQADPAAQIPSTEPINRQSQSSVASKVAMAASSQPSHKHHHIMQLPGVYGEVMRANPSNYTVQLIADSGLRSLFEYMRAYCLGYSAIPLHTKHLGKNWYVLVYGQFDNVYQANNALQQFPYSALKWRPFVRRISDVQRFISDPRGEDALIDKRAC